MNDPNEVLAEAAEALAHAGACLAELAECDNAAPQSDPEAEARWLRGAKRELDEPVRWKLAGATGTW